MASRRQRSILLRSDDRSNQIGPRRSCLLRQTCGKMDYSRPFAVPVGGPMNIYTDYCAGACGTRVSAPGLWCMTCWVSVDASSKTDLSDPICQLPEPIGVGALRPGTTGEVPQIGISMASIAAEWFGARHPLQGAADAFAKIQENNEALDPLNGLKLTETAKFGGIAPIQPEPVKDLHQIRLELVAAAGSLAFGPESGKAAALETISHLVTVLQHSQTNP